MVVLLVIAKAAIVMAKLRHKKKEESQSGVRAAIC